MSSRTKQILSGVLMANGALVLLMALTLLVAKIGAPKSSPDYQYIGVFPPSQGSSLTIFATSDFVLIPMLMGAIMAYRWKDLPLNTGANISYSLLSLLLGLLLCVLFLHEGVICLVMASPLLLLFLWLGFEIGKALASYKNRRLEFTLVPLLLIAMIADVMTMRGFDGQVTDRITIHAPPRTVWRYIIDYPAITEAPDYWLWKIGLPAPVQSKVSAHAVGALRQCVFTGNIAFDERITQLRPEKELAFDVISQPKDPDVIGHFVLHKGQFLLQDNGDGTTTVTGTSWYTLNVHPTCYYDLWVQTIVRHVHMRVMNHIKTLAERPNP